MDSRLLAPAWAALAFHLLVTAVYLAAHRGDVSALVCAADTTAGRPPFEAVRVGMDKGFDGQFYYAIARKPWGRHDYLDQPAYRQARILYPLLGWLFSSGNPQRLLWVLPAINLAALAGLAWIGAWVARQYGRSEWWGFLLPLAVNDGLGVLRDLTDPVALLAIAGLLAAWLFRPGGWLIVGAAAAVFSRQQNVVIVLLLLIAVAWSRKRGLAVGLGLVLIAWGGWVLILRHTYHLWPVPPPEDGNLGLPLTGMIYRWTHLAGTPPSTASAVLHALRMLHLSLQILLAFAAGCWRVDRVVAGVALAGALLAMAGGMLLYEDAWSYTRVFAWLPLGLWFAGIATGRRWPLLLLAPAGLWPIAAVVKAWC
jgi:hypothetical protein